MKKINVAIIGAGRIGRMHAEVILKEIGEAKLKIIFDKYKKKDWLRKFSDYQAHEIEVTDDLKKISQNKAIDAVIIASSTTSHIPLIKEFLSHKPAKHIFCEKPLAINSKDFTKLTPFFKTNGFIFQVGYNRRYDENFIELKNSLKKGKVGKPYIIKIINRDPVRPPLNFIPKSGGMIFDFNTHDFDMIKFLSGERIKEVVALSGNLVDPKIGELGDIDTVLINLRLESGVIANIDSSRESNYGYDQQIEILGSKGSIKASNIRENSVQLSTKAGVNLAKPKFNFAARYHEAFINQSRSFFNLINQRNKSNNSKKFNQNSLSEIEDARQAILVAEAVNLSLKMGKVVPVKY